MQENAEPVYVWNGFEEADDTMVFGLRKIKPSYHINGWKQPSEKYPVLLHMYGQGPRVNYTECVRGGVLTLEAVGDEYAFEIIGQPKANKVKIRVVRVNDKKQTKRGKRTA